MTPNYDAIRVAFATGNPVAARDDMIAAIQEAVEHSHHSGEAVRVIRRYLAAMDAGKADRARSLDFDFMEVPLADRGVNLPETERKQ